MEQPVSGRAIMMARDQAQRASSAEDDQQWADAMLSALATTGQSALIINMVAACVDAMSAIDAEFTVVDVKRVDHE